MAKLSQAHPPHQSVLSPMTENPRFKVVKGCAITTLPDWSSTTLRCEFVDCLVDLRLADMSQTPDRLPARRPVMVGKRVINGPAHTLDQVLGQSAKQPGRVPRMSGRATAPMSRSSRAASSSRATSSSRVN